MTFRIRVVTETVLGGLYTRDLHISSAFAFEESDAFHNIVLEALRVEGVSEDQLNKLKLDNLCFTDAISGQHYIMTSPMHIPEGSMLWYRDFAPDCCTTLQRPQHFRVESSNLMLATKDPKYLSVFISGGHTVKIPFPVAEHEVEVRNYAVEALRCMGIAYNRLPKYCVCEAPDNDDAQYGERRPRSEYNGRIDLHTKSLELVGQWERIPAQIDAVPVPDVLAVHPAHCDALLPLRLPVERVASTGETLVAPVP